jgi:hypothetical protein
VIDCIAGYHLNEYTCGIAKFNTRLAEQLSVPVVPLESLSHLKYTLPLLSLNVAELSPMAQRRLGQWLSTGPLYDVLLHGVSGATVEAQLVQRASRKFGANRVIARAMGGSALWCPSTVTVPRHQKPDLRILTFGMAHKLALRHYEKLAKLLDGQDYVLDVSTALHEDTPWQQAMESLCADLTSMFGARVRMAGYLADGALSETLRSATVVAAFFPHGVRENNTTVWAALNAGTPVLTNTDSASRPWFLHGQTVLDVTLLSQWPTMAQLAEVAAGGMQLAAEQSWDRLCGLIRGAA